MSEQLVKSMLAGKGMPHACDNPRLIETHISWLVLVGDFAYKLKKPVNLGFLDFSTLAQRKHFCEEEIRLNRRTAPDIYLDVQPISGSESTPLVGDGRRVFEYAVRMRRFDNAALLDRLARAQQLDETVIHALARAIALFHDLADRSLPDPGFATAEAVRAPVDDNFRILFDAATAPPQRKLLRKLVAWSETEFQSRRADFTRRRSLGYARECHGDLHLGNVLYREGKCTLFDCIEFNAALRWIDVASDIAFTIMDIESHLGPRFAWLLVNEYLQLTGDYGALSVLDYYKVYRALVRAKVAAIRASQDVSHAGALGRDCGHYLELAMQFAGRGQPFMLLMSGLSGTGKTWVARKLGAELQALHIRSDVERKRLFKLAIDANSHALGLDIYTADANESTFDVLAGLTENALNQRYPIIVDATFIAHDLRRRFTGLAHRHRVPWAIVACKAPEATVKARLASREGDASEAGIHQYLGQKSQVDPFDEDEMRHLVTVDTTDGLTASDLAARIRQRLT